MKDKEKQFRERVECGIAYCEDTPNNQIEEMAQCKNFHGFICSECSLKGGCDRYILAKELYNAGYRKLSDDSVVLSREEYEKTIQEKLKLGMEIGKRQSSKETAEKIIDYIDAEIRNYISDSDFDLFNRDMKWLKQRCGVEIKE